MKGTPGPWTVHHFVDIDADTFGASEQGLYEIEEANEQVNDLRRDGELDEALAVAEANRALIQAAPELEAKYLDAARFNDGHEARVRELEGNLAHEANETRRRCAVMDELARERDEWKARCAQMRAALEGTDGVRKFARWAIEESWEGFELDGGSVQDMAVECGLLTKSEYDPVKHGPSEDGEPGDPWYEMTDAIARAAQMRAALEGFARKGCLCAKEIEEETGQPGTCATASPDHRAEWCWTCIARAALEEKEATT